MQPLDWGTRLPVNVCEEVSVSYRTRIGVWAHIEPSLGPSYQVMRTLYLAVATS